MRTVCQARPKVRDGRAAATERGVALVVALLILSFLSVIGAALLTSVVIETRLADNYAAAAVLRYAAEGGIEEGREALRQATRPISQLLAEGAGPDGRFVDLRAGRTGVESDDVPFLRRNTWATAFAGGRMPQFSVFLRHPSGAVPPLTGNRPLLELVSIAGLGGPARAVIQAWVEKSGFPPVPAALTLNGVPAALSGAPVIAGVPDNIGVITAGEQERIGADTVKVVEADLHSWLRTPAGLERIVDGIRANARASYMPPAGSPASIGNAGSATHPAVVFVDGDAVFGPGTGFGVLVVRGRLAFRGQFLWSGLILAIGEGEVSMAPGAAGSVVGGVFLARTRDAAGRRLAERGPVAADLGGGVITIRGDRDAEAAANAHFPWVPVGYREY